MPRNQTDINKNSEERTIGKGRKLVVETRRTASRLALTLTLPEKAGCVLHWGVCRQPNDPWQLPPRSIWPEGSHAEGKAAVQTPFSLTDGVGTVSIDLPVKRQFSFLVFVLYFPEDKSWDNNRGKNYFIRLPQADESLFSPARATGRRGQGPGSGPPAELRPRGRPTARCCGLQGKGAP